MFAKTAKLTSAAVLAAAASVGLMAASTAPANAATGYPDEDEIYVNPCPTMVEDRGQVVLVCDDGFAVFDLDKEVKYPLNARVYHPGQKQAGSYEINSINVVGVGLDPDAEVRVFFSDPTGDDESVSYATILNLGTGAVRALS